MKKVKKVIPANKQTLKNKCKLGYLQGRLEQVLNNNPSMVKNFSPGVYL